MNIVLERRESLSDIKIKSVFQPLYSVHEKKYIGVEALSRGINSKGLIPAPELFNIPQNGHEKFNLNMRCIENALKTLEKVPDLDGYSIFLNIDSSLMDTSAFDLEKFFSSLENTKIEAERIVIELIESRVKDFETLMDFVSACRKKGYLIALDDAGAGYSNFERIVKIKPDVIKIDRALVDGVSEEFHKREVCRALIELSRNIGALSLAEGIETLDDALECQDMGVDLIQGYYLSKPIESIAALDASTKKISLFVETCNFTTKERNKRLRTDLARIKRQSLFIYNLLLDDDISDWDEILRSSIDRLPEAECAYLLNKEGIQISKSALRTNVVYKKHFLFSPAKRGADHSQKYYFLKRSPNQKWYISDPYLSSATGNICRTVSLYFEVNKNAYYLCLDIKN
ncbi:MAG: EAL domain-containing protein [Spirochaetales bacterium]|nr:EAL domain-containing protein [Spirochaetales bacterium]